MNRKNIIQYCLVAFLSVFSASNVFAAIKAELKPGSSKYTRADKTINVTALISNIEVGDTVYTRISWYKPKGADNHADAPRLLISQRESTPYTRENRYDASIIIRGSSFNAEETAAIQLGKWFVKVETKLGENGSWEAMDELEIPVTTLEDDKFTEEYSLLLSEDMFDKYNNSYKNSQRDKTGKTIFTGKKPYSHKNPITSDEEREKEYVLSELDYLMFYVDFEYYQAHIEVELMARYLNEYPVAGRSYTSDNKSLDYTTRVYTGQYSSYDPKNHWHLPGQWSLDLSIDGEKVDTIPFKMLDDIKPEIKIKSPDPEEEKHFTKEDIFSVTYSAIENGYWGLQSITWQVEGVDEKGNKLSKSKVIPLREGSFSRDGTKYKVYAHRNDGIPLFEGTNTITITTTDLSGNESEPESIVVVKNTPPKLSPSGKLNTVYDEESQTKTVTVTLNATDVDENLQSISMNWGTSSEVKAIAGGQASVTFTHTYGINDSVIWTAIAKDSVDEESEPVVGTEDDILYSEEIAEKNGCKQGVGDPIDVATGAQYLNENLLSINGQLPLIFSLDYNSMLMKKGRFGRSWGDTNYGTSLKQSPTGEVTIHWTTNRYNRFNPIGNSQYRSSHLSCSNDLLIKEADAWQLTRKNGQVYRFNLQGQLIQKGTKTQLFADLSYDESGKLIQVTEPAGRYLRYQYTNGRVTSVVNSAGHQVQFTYDEEGNLTHITDPVGAVTTYTHNSYGQIVAATNAEGQQIFRNVFDDSTHQVIEQYDGVNTQPLRLNYNTRTFKRLITTVTDKTNKTRVYTFTTDFKLLSIVDEAGKSTQYQYNNKGKVSVYTDAKGNTTRFFYDEHGNLTQTTDPRGTIITRHYDENNNLTLIMKPENANESFHYDDKNRLIKYGESWQSNYFSYDENGQLYRYSNANSDYKELFTYQQGLVKTITYPKGNIHTFDYDAAGRIIASTNGEGQTIRIAYDAKDRITGLTDALGNTVQLRYNSRDQVIQFTDAMGNNSYRAYDANGRLISKTNALNQVTQYEYDINDRLIAVVDAKGQRTAQFKYDNKGRITVVIDALNRRENFDYDALGNLTKHTNGAGVPTTFFSYDKNSNIIQVDDVLGGQTQHQYDALNRLVKTTNALGHETTFARRNVGGGIYKTVDALKGVSEEWINGDRLISRLVDPNKNKTTFTYDENKRLIAETVATGKAVNYQYNASNLLTQITNARGQQRQLSYDKAGRLIKLVDEEGTIEYSYDANSNVLTVSDKNGTITRTYDVLNRVTSYTDINGNTLHYSYDEVGNLASITYPDGKQVVYGYNAAGQLITVTDWAGRLTQYFYNTNKRLVRTQRPNGTIDERRYDPLGRVIVINDFKPRKPRGEIIAQYQYRYDALGNMIEENKFPVNTVPQVDLTMDYGLANQLANVAQQATVLDDDGNLLEAVLAGQKTNFSFSSRNQLLQAGTTVYRYDAENQRIGVNDTQYVVNSQPKLSQVLVRTQGNGKVTYYVYGLGLIGEATEDNYISYHFDYRGSTVALTDLNGEVVDRVQYSPFGELLSQPTQDTPFLFNGMYGVMHDENDLYYMRARFYSPQIRRFVNQDVLLGDIQDGQSLNRYAYVTGNPVSFVDPFGLAEMLGGEYIKEFPGFPSCSCGNPFDVIKNALSDTRDWSYYADRSDVHSSFVRGKNKCNIFVDVMYEKSGYYLPNIGGGLLARLLRVFPPGAESASDPNYHIPGWDVVSEPLPGDLAAEDGHVGIVSFKKDSTVSASPQGVIENDWGFRNNQPNTVFRRCSCK